eukprot:3530058-Rhodomonas_salina.3
MALPGNAMHLRAPSAQPLRGAGRKDGTRSPKGPTRSLVLRSRMVLATEAFGRTGIGYAATKLVLRSASTETGYAASDLVLRSGMLLPGGQAVGD